MSKYPFWSKCPSCTNNQECHWHHHGCPSGYYQQIDSKGYLYCDYCDEEYHIIDAEFNCGMHNDGFRAFDIERLDNIVAFFYTTNRMPKAFIKELKKNVKKRWKESHPFDSDSD